MKKAKGALGVFFRFILFILVTIMLIVFGTVGLIIGTGVFWFKSGYEFGTVFNLHFLKKEE